ncbi:MAG: hydantoinase B/oxoprolinase family protein [Phycisphaerales bacterium]|nr:hydantoinase B/oxoprolinase family protein [Phycisphaerales bacterium]
MEACRSSPTDGGRYARESGLVKSRNWQFAIDVGGTFTDVVACAPDGRLHTHKLLSSGRCVGAVDDGSTRDALVDARRCDDPPGFWRGYGVEVRDADGAVVHRAVVRAFDAPAGRLVIEPAMVATPQSGWRYELTSTEPAPVVAMRYLTHCGLHDALPDLDLRLGTTRATNALLERKGARTVFVTTAGFGDILYIANQDRPKLFDLHIVKPEQVAAQVVEIDERLSADGRVLKALDASAVRAILAGIADRDRCSLAVCLLHAHKNSAHKERIGEIAAELGFAHVSLSSQVAPLPRIVSRGDTTVVDAYLAPVLHDYVSAVARALPSGSLRLMTSAGGLVDARQVVAKDTLLSGPAGGVVGFAHVGRQAGFDRAIGFDMGGTSTDVARYDGAFEHQFETVKGGVRIVAPMLAVETVAAGGGSICAFDGQKLTVGPHSAGASPGPACYGAGGPLTVTDVNVQLGRVLPSHFPFPLDTNAVANRLAQIAGEVQRAAGRSMTHDELAAGFCDIANENMAAAIRRISVARGYDPRDYALVAFGGAGGQHACAVAELLGIERVLLSPHAGLLSALGISVADVQRFAARAVGKVLSDATLRELDPWLTECEAELAREIEAEGVAPDAVQPATRMFDLRYVGADSALTIVADDGDYAAAFERMHEQHYGYRHAGRGIEITAIRVERIGKTKSPPSPQYPAADGLLVPMETTSVYFNGARRETPVFDRHAMRAGQRIAGPAIVFEAMSTIVIPSDWSGEVLATGDILLSAPQRKVNAETSTECDPIRLELFNNRFAAIAEQMGTTLRRTALSTNVKERLDYSCAVFAADGALLVNAPHMPVHLGSMSDCVKAVVAAIPNLAPGDVVLNNDPFSGGTHIPDVTCVTPMFDASGERIEFFVASRAHHAEIGGTHPGSMPATATTLAEEGVLIRHFKVVDRGTSRMDALRALLTSAPFPSRAPDDNLADITAQIAANQTGINALRDFLKRSGREVVHAYARHIREAAEVKMRAALARLPDGRYSYDDALDDGSRVCCAIDVRGDTACIDFTGSAGVHPGNFNANRSIVSSVVLYCFRCLIAEDIPLNAGVLAPLELIVPEGMLAPPVGAEETQCPAVAAGNVETSQRLVDVIFGALGTVAASQGTMNNLIFGAADWGYYETIAGGAGAGPGFDGADAVHTHMTNTRQTDPEVLENRYPVRLWRLAVRKGSGGKGRHRGGDGLVREIEFLAPADVSIISQRRMRPPFGLNGGAPGAVGKNQLRRAGASEWEQLPGVTSCRVECGDTLRIETPGGGGFGSAEV